MELTAYLEKKGKLIEGALDRLLPSNEAEPKQIHESIRYSVFAGGKRLRPTLCLATLEALGKNPMPALPAACALELIHTYSLIHDDLPCMDNDDLRRGKPTNHKVFGEATALLAGDALLTKAFELISSVEAIPASVTVELVHQLAYSSGTAGLIGGQALDLASEGKKVSRETVEYIHSHKTAALIETSVVFGAILGGATDEQRNALSTYGRALGMAFQITDDILDMSGDEKKLGKRVGKDAEAQKASYPALYGLDSSRAIAQDYTDKALEAINRFDEKAQPLREIARYLLSRER